MQTEDIGVRVGQRFPAGIDDGGEPRRFLPALDVERELLERSHVRAERADGVEQLLFLELRDAVVGGQTLVGPFDRDDVLELGLVDGSELLPLSGVAVERLQDLRHLELLHARGKQRLEGIERRAVLGRSREDVSVREDRAVQIVQLPLVHLPKAVAELDDLFGRLGDLRLARQDLRELGPALGLRVEAVERADRRLVLRVHLDDPLVARDGVTDVVELGLEDLRGAET